MKKIIFLLFAAFLSQQAFSQPFIDGSFNNNTGIATISAFSAKAVARSGKLIVVAGIVNTGDVKVYFYNEDGSPLPAMGNSGSTTIALAANTLNITGIAIDPDSKRIYISGTRNLAGLIDGFIISLNALGNINTSFSGDGYLDFSAMPGSQNLNAIGVQSTGRIIAAGDSSSKYMVAGFLPTGILDNSFSGDGLYVQPAINPTTPVTGTIKKLDINSIDEIYTAGTVSTNSTYVLSLNANGSLLKLFPTNLSYYTIAGIKYYNGKIIIASGYQYSTPATIKLSCFLPNGSFDTNFNGNGTFTTTTGYSDFLTDLNIDQEGRIVASGYSNTGPSSFDYKYSILRVSWNGTLDPIIGYSILPSSPANSSNGSILTSDGKLLIAGHTPAGATAPISSLVKVCLKAIHYPTWPLFSSVKYFGSDAFALPDYSSGVSKISYTSNNPSKASITYGRIVTIRDTGVVGIRARIPEDSFYYAFDSIDYLRIEPKAPAIITGKKIVPEGVGTVVKYKILPQGLFGSFEFNELGGSRTGGTHHFVLSQNTDSITLYFDEFFEGGTLAYRYTNATKDNIEITSNVIAQPRAEGSADIRQELECTQELVSCAGNFIDHFRLNTLSNDSSGCGNGGYHDFTFSGKTTHLFLGEIYTAKIKTITHITSPAYIGLWIDYNNNGDFSDPEDYIISDFADPSGFKSIKISIRNDKSYVGSRRLRVRYRTTPIQSTDACQLDGESGETEDYLIILKEQESLQGPNVVTPNEDGKNDYLTIRGVNAKFSNRHLVIFDRLGDVKYSNEAYNNDWAGKNNKGELLSKGTYYYIFTNGDNSVKGFFELLY